MRRELGWAPAGTRARGTRPQRNWKTVSLIGAIRLGERPRLMTHQGSVDGAVFLRFVKERLAPWLKPGDVVVMDNLNFHKMRVVRDAIEQAGAQAVYLPTYSPELNPIEKWWADMKRGLKKLGLNAVPELKRAVRRLRAGLPLEKVSAWFRFSLAEAQLK